MTNHKQTDDLDPDRLHASKIYESLTQQDGIDYNNTFNLVTDIWLFLTDMKLPEQATIKREAFFHEVSAMIDAVRSVAARNPNSPLYIKSLQSDLRALIEEEIINELGYTAKRAGLIDQFVAYFNDIFRSASKIAAYKVVNMLLELKDKEPLDEQQRPTK